MNCEYAKGAQKWLSIGLLAGIGITVFFLWQKRKDRHGDNALTETEIDEAIEMTFPASDPPAY